MEIKKVLVVDDHPVIQEGLHLYFENIPDLEIVGSAQCALEGLDKLREYEPEFVILDIAMPEIDGLEAIEMYLKEKPDVNIVIFSGLTNETYVYQAFKLGIKAYVVKGNSLAELVKAIREIQFGNIWLSPELNSVVMDGFLDSSESLSEELNDYKLLTKREQQVFRLLAKGRSTTEVAEALFISPQTVSKHRVAIKNKLEVGNLAEMANYAAKIGLSIDLEEQSLDS